VNASALFDHLWQSSLFVVLAWCFAVLLRRNRARVRFWVWLAASVKFLVPFSLLSAAGGLFGWRMTPADGASMPGFDSWVAPLVSPAATWVAAVPTDFDFARVLLIVWVLGAALLLARWVVRWRQVMRIVRSATPSTIDSRVPVRVSATLREPGVVGILRPMLVLPEKIADCLQPEELAAILEHELCHVRRRDNLWAALHMLVEALFWFHPLVWWLGGRLVEEREQACDEAVLESGANPRGYAQGILKVCQFYMASKLACVSGVSGANLKIRLEGIMKNQKAVELTSGRKLLLGFVALATLTMPVISGMAATGPASATPAATSAGKIVLLADRRVKLHYENVDVRSLLQALAQAANVNMLVSDQVTGSVTVRLDALPWEQALDVVLAAKGLGRHENAGLIIVEPLASMKN